MHSQERLVRCIAIIFRRMDLELDLVERAAVAGNGDLVGDAGTEWKIQQDRTSPELFAAVMIAVAFRAVAASVVLTLQLDFP